jgi:hypothetical protein
VASLRPEAPKEGTVRQGEQRMRGDMGQVVANAVDKHLADVHVRSFPPPVGDRGERLLASRPYRVDGRHGSGLAVRPSPERRDQSRVGDDRQGFPLRH